ncbi:hypothetical protein CB696_00150 [Salmonella enterica subsp. enterica serovar Livingstone]|nr:hypothetical protein [Salmonella enterica subsp. enterica serovar Livingstone]
MVAVVEEELTKLAQEMDSDEAESEGSSVTDLITAANEAEGKNLFDEVDPELVEAMKDEPVVVEEPVKVEEDVTPVVEESQEQPQVPDFMTVDPEEDYQRKLNADSTKIANPQTKFCSTIHFLITLINSSDHYIFSRTLL